MNMWDVRAAGRENERRWYQPSARRAADMELRHRMGWTYQAIARLYDLSTSNVCRIVQHERAQRAAGITDEWPE